MDQPEVADYEGKQQAQLGNEQLAADRSKYQDWSNGKYQGVDSVTQRHLQAGDVKGKMQTGNFDIPAVEAPASELPAPAVETADPNMGAGMFRMPKTAGILYAALMLNHQKRASSYDPDDFLKKLDNPDPKPVPKPAAAPTKQELEDQKLLAKTRQQFDPTIRAAKEKELAQREGAEASLRSQSGFDPAQLKIRNDYEAAKNNRTYTNISEAAYNAAVKSLDNTNRFNNRSYSAAANTVDNQATAAK